MSQMDPKQKALFEDIGFMGTGRAAILLSLLLNKKISMAITHVSIMTLKKLIKKLSRQDTLWVGTYLTLTGAVTGYIQLILSYKDAIKLADVLIYGHAYNSKTVYEMGQRAIKEVTQLLCASYFTALYESTELMFSSSTPRILIDNPSGIIEGALTDILPDEKDVSALVTTFVETSTRIKGYLAFVPSPHALETLIHTLDQASAQ